MKITCALLWLSLLVVVSCENSTDASSTVNNSTTNNQKQLVVTLKQLLTTVNNNKYLADTLDEKLRIGNSPGLSTFVDALVQFVDSNQALTDKKIADLTKIVNDIISATAQLEGILMQNQQTTDAGIAQLSATITTNSNQLSVKIDALQSSVDANELTVEGKLSDLDKYLASFTSALQQLKTIVETNQQTTDTEIAQLASTITSYSEALAGLVNGLGVTISGGQTIIEGFFTEVKTKVDTIYANIVTQITSLQSAVFTELGNIGTRLTGFQTTLSTIVSTAQDILNILLIPSCKSPGASGVYKLQSPSMKVYCELVTLNGGWIVIQQRVDVTFDFNRLWSDYRNGFGEVGNKENFWFGLENLYQLTSTGQWELAIEFKDNSGSNNKVAQYTSFAVGSESTKYRLLAANYVAGSQPLGDFLSANSGAKFSTSDSDNDGSMANCAQTNSGGWWYTNCGNSDLNSKTAPTWNKISGTYSRMMIRRK